MKSILLRGVSDEMMERLKARARQHHRSLQGELHAVLEAALNTPTSSGGDFPLKTVRTSNSSRWSREEIYED